MANKAVTKTKITPEIRDNIKSIGENQVDVFKQLLDYQNKQLNIAKQAEENNDRENERQFKLADKQIGLNEKWWTHRKSILTIVLKYSCIATITFFAFLIYLAEKEQWALLTGIISHLATALLGLAGGWGLKTYRQNLTKK